MYPPASGNTIGVMETSTTGSGKDTRRGGKAMSNTQKTHKRDGAGSHPIPNQFGALIAAGFDPQQIARLSKARDRFQSGALSDWPDDRGRLRFARWLYRHGRLDG
jgi:hypothetical protein